MINIISSSETVAELTDILYVCLSVCMTVYLSVFICSIIIQHNNGHDSRTGQTRLTPLTSMLKSMKNNKIKNNHYQF